MKNRYIDRDEVLSTLDEYIFAAHGYPYQMLTDLRKEIADMPCLVAKEDSQTLKLYKGEGGTEDDR